MPQPPFIGLTGAVAAGKTVTLAAFEAQGAATLSTDAVVHELYGDPQLVARVVERWGEEVAPQGVVDREAVAQRVFGAPGELAWLESILHPMVGARVAGWRSEVPESAPAAIVEVPLLFESGMDAAFEQTICVIADDELRRGRAGARGTAELAGREARQLSAEEKAERADHVIRNDGSLADLELRVGEVLAAISGDGREGSKSGGADEA